MALQSDPRFMELNLPTLRGLAKTFKVNLNGKTRKPEIIDDLLTSGVTWEMYEGLRDVPNEPTIAESFDLPEVSEPEETEPTVNDTAAPVRELDEIEKLLGEDFSDLDEPVVSEPVYDNSVNLEPGDTTAVNDTGASETVLVPVVVEEEPEIEYTLIKMTRENRIFERYGYRFTREAPYMLVDENSADKLIEEIGGFRRASSREVKEFYGG